MELITEIDTLLAAIDQEISLLARVTTAVSYTHLTLPTKRIV